MPGPKSPEDKKPEGARPIETPVDLTSQDGLDFLNKVLPKEAEKEKHDPSKRKTFQAGIPHKFPSVAGKVIFNQDFFRRKEMYDYIYILSASDNFPDDDILLKNRKPNILYFKKIGEEVWVKGFYEDKVVAKILTPAQVEQLRKIKQPDEAKQTEVPFFDFDLSQTKKIEDTPANHKQISAAMKIAGFTEYVYRIHPVKDSSTDMGRGASGHVYSAEEESQFKQIDGRMQRVKDARPRVVKYIDLPKEEDKRTIVMGKVRNEGAMARRVDRSEMGQENKGQENEGLNTGKPVIDKITGTAVIEMDRAGEWDLGIFCTTLELKDSPKKLSLEQYKKLIKNIIQAVQNLHIAGVLHNDLKPENIMIDPDSLEVRIVDFETSHPKGSLNQSTKGTWVWASPEMLADPATVDEGHDIYSVGMLLRKLCLDMAFRERSAILEVQSKRPGGMYNVANYIILEYFLDIPVVDFFRDDKQETPASEWQTIARVLNGMTRTRRDERFSLEKALSILDGQPEEKDEKEQKGESAVLPESKLEPVPIVYYFSFDALSEEAKRYILRQLLNKLRGLAEKNPAPYLYTPLQEIFSRNVDSVPLEQLTELTMLTREIVFRVQHKAQEVDSTRTADHLREWQEINDGKKAVAERLKKEDPAMWAQQETRAEPQPQPQPLEASQPVQALQQPQEIKLENKKVEGVLIIDPLTQKGLDFLEQVLPDEEKKGKRSQDSRIHKDKIFEVDKEYYFAAKPNQPVKFTRPFFRTKKMYDYVKLLGPEEKLPSSEQLMADKQDQSKPNILYFKKEEDGAVVTGIYEDKVVTNQLSEVDVSELKKLFGNNFGRLSKRIEDFGSENHKKISAAMKICGFAKYTYHIESVSDDEKAEIGSGAFGKVSWVVTGKLESKQGRLHYFRDVTPKVVKHIEPENKQDSKARDSTMEATRRESDLARKVDRWNKEHGKPEFGVQTKKATIDRATGVGRILMGNAGSCDLDKFIKKLKKKETVLTGEEYETLVKNIMEALRSVDQAGVFDRDIKPQNIMINEQTFAVKIVDFGQAITDKEIISSQNELAGTPHWLSPEMGARSHNVDKKSSVYAVGLLLRKLCQDVYVEKMVEAYDFALPEEEVEQYGDKAWKAQAEAYCGAQYYLNIPLQEADFSRSGNALTAAAEKPRAQKLAMIFNGMTATRPDERWSLEKALSVLENPNEHKEEKRALQEPNAVQKVKGYFCLMSLSTSTRWHVLYQLEFRLIGAVDELKLSEEKNISDATKHFFKDYLEQITKLAEGSQSMTSTEHAHVHSRLPDLIVLTREVLSAAQKRQTLGREQILKFQEEFDAVIRRGKNVVGLRLKSQASRTWTEQEKLQKAKNAATQKWKWTKAWNATFLDGKSRAECENLSKMDQFLNFIGFPPKHLFKFPKPSWTFGFIVGVPLRVVGLGILLAIWAACAPLVITKNVVKLLTELPLKRWADSYDGKPTSLGKGVSNVMLWLVRAVTSPIVNFQESKKQQGWPGIVLPILSCIASGVGLLGMGIAIGPLIAAIAPELGTGVFSFFSSTQAGSAVLSLVETVLTTLGYAVTNTLIGSVITSVAGLFSITGLNRIREALTPPSAPLESSQPLPPLPLPGRSPAAVELQPEFQASNAYKILHRKAPGFRQEGNPQNPDSGGPRNGGSPPVIKTRSMSSRSLPPEQSSGPVSVGESLGKRNSR